MVGHSRALKTEFGKHSALYDEARPTYPRWVVDEVLRQSHIPSNGHILDIGCGPGRATILFGERGYSVLGVDLSEDLISLAQQKSRHLPNIEYRVGEFEHLALPLAYFDLVLAAQSLHWIEPNIGYQKIADILTNTGMLAAFWNFERYEQGGLSETVREMYRKHCPAFPHDLGSPERYIAETGASGYFNPSNVYTHNWTWAITKDQYGKLARSWAWVSSLSEAESRTFLEELSNVLDKEPENLSVPFKTVLLTTTKLEKKLVYT